MRGLIILKQSRSKTHCRFHLIQHTLQQKRVASSRINSRLQCCLGGIIQGRPINHRAHFCSVKVCSIKQLARVHRISSSCCCISSCSRSISSSFFGSVSGCFCLFGHFSCSFFSSLHRRFFRSFGFFCNRSSLFFGSHCSFVSGLFGSFLSGFQLFCGFRSSLFSYFSRGFFSSFHFFGSFCSSFSSRSFSRFCFFSSLHCGFLCRLLCWYIAELVIAKTCSHYYGGAQNHTFIHL